MLPVLVLLLISAIGETLLRPYEAAQALLVVQEEQMAVELVDDLEEAIRLYEQLYATYPASFADFDDKPGFQHFRLMLTEEFEYYRATAVTNSRWTYERALVGWQSAGEFTAALDTINTCGGVAWATEPSWCLQLFERAHVFNEGEDYLDYFIDEMDTLSDLNASLINSFNATGSIIDRYSDSSTITPGIATPLRDLVGESLMTQATCNASYNWRGMSLHCEDFFTSSGAPISYTYVNSNEFILLAPTRAIDETGAVVNASIRTTVVL